MFQAVFLIKEEHKVHTHTHMLRVAIDLKLAASRQNEEQKKSRIENNGDNDEGMEK